MFTDSFGSPINIGDKIIILTVIDPVIRRIEDLSAIIAFNNKMGKYTYKINGDFIDYGFEVIKTFKKV